MEDEERRTVLAIEVTGAARIMIAIAIVPDHAIAGALGV